MLDLPLENLSFNFCGQRVSSEELLSNNIPTEPYPSKVLVFLGGFLVLPYVSSILESFNVLHFGMSCAMQWDHMSNCHGRSQLKFTCHLDRPGLMSLIRFCQEERQMLFPLGYSPSGCARMCF